MSEKPKESLDYADNEDLIDNNLNEIDILKDIYKDVSEWLKFAEAKNGVLLTLCGVFLFGILRLITVDNEVII